MRAEGGGDGPAAVPQVLAAMAEAGEAVAFQNAWGDVPNMLGLDTAASPAQFYKGRAPKGTVALVIMNMQPLFYSGSSCWGTRGGLETSLLNALPPKQLMVADAIRRYTGRQDSVVLAQYVPPATSEEARGVNRQFFGSAAGRCATRAALDAAGLNATHLYGAMPELQPLLDTGAQRSVRSTPGAFGPGSDLGLLLDRYFESTGAGNVHVLKTVLFAGISLDSSILSSVTAAFSAYYRTVVLSDATSTYSPNSGFAVYDYIFPTYAKFIDVVTAEEAALVFSESTLPPKPAPELTEPEADLIRAYGDFQRNGRPIPQALATMAALGLDIRLDGQAVPAAPMTVELAEGSGLPQFAKGAVHPDNLALVVIDMTPLFYSNLSIWGTAGGITQSSMNTAWPRILKLADAVRAFTGRNDSVFLTEYIPARSPATAPGIFRYYYSPGNDFGGTIQGMREKGYSDAQIDYLLGVMPQLQVLVKEGAQVAQKNAASAFGPGSSLPGLLSNYFEATGAGAGTEKTLIFTGTEANYCVLASALGAMDFYYRPVVIADAVASSNPTAAKAVFDYIMPSFHNFADTASTHEALTVLERNTQALANERAS